MSLSIVKYIANHSCVINNDRLSHTCNFFRVTPFGGVGAPVGFHAVTLKLHNLT